VKKFLHHPTLLHGVVFNLSPGLNNTFLNNITIMKDELKTILAE
jgi:hypothetical protein